ncbi:hypothetical protein QAD02_005761 [Eretmocerus hayati]|uniref:Uncharacterized protein n=1 Tax=Eretmocerus hayati TaxID=131215 RepID=A0ACC2NTC9_9HYME|nr:hypothetical protein QAD02_005761 [Eretmocerus hayati]
MYMSLTGAMAAVTKGRPDLVRLLLKYGARVAIPPRRMTQNLAHAFFRIVPQDGIPQYNKLDIIEMLITSRMDLRELDGFPEIPAVILESITCDVLRVIVEGGMIVPGYYEEEEMLGIGIALRNDDKQVWEYLIKNELIDLCEYNSEGKSILMIESEYDSPYLLKLLSFGANPNE